MKCGSGRRNARPEGFLAAEPEKIAFDGAVMAAHPTCPFCQLPQERVWLECPEAVAVFDGYPISPGHTLIIPRRHVGSFFELSLDEQTAILLFVNQVRAELIRTQQPDSFNLGLNDGPEAGQTIAHCHLHLIPRRKGDVEDPRGGVRWIIPSKARYW
jgi:diadenosine tetraphosphate (Ap4A) HIT family hydrolase